MTDDQARHTVPLADVVLPAYNPRKLSREQAAHLKESLTKFGPVDPIVVNRRNRHVVGGNQRVLVARKLGWETFPVVWVDLDDERERELNVRLNANGGDFDIALLAAEFAREDLIAWGLGDDWTSDLDAYLSANAKKKSRAENDLQTDVPKRTNSGDLWLLGPHRLFCGDATDPASYSRLLREPADLLLTDPPYNVAYSGGQCQKRRPILNDSLGDDFTDFLQKFFVAVAGGFSGAGYIFMSYKEMSALDACAQKNGWHRSLPLVWVKSSFALSRSDYHPQTEMCFYGWPKKNRRYWAGGRNQGNVLFFDKPGTSDLHPTQKPVALFERLVINSCPPGGTVLDPFAGSGTALIACENLCRVFAGIELDPHYCDVILRRYEQLSGQCAEKAVG